MSRILFSPIGGTDPISNFHDGAMLHISRHFLPDKVYLYLSKEMCEFHERCDGYVYCLEKLGELLNHKFEIHVLKRPELVEVQRFDSFYVAFRKIIKEIRNDGDELLLNISSGTPAMKSSLNLIATLSEFELKPIQVSTPLKKINKHEDKREEYEPDIQWECNEDNDENSTNRCEIIPCVNQLAEITKSNIVKQIEAYDYFGAMVTAKTIKDFLSDDVIRLLKCACNRIQLNYREAVKCVSNEKNEFFPRASDRDRDVFEYFLYLQMKCVKCDLADFVRGITPFVFECGRMVLTNVNKSWQSYTKNNKGEKWDINKIKANDGLMQYLNQKYHSQFDSETIYATHLFCFADYFSPDKKCIELINEIDKISKTVRNFAAHEITPVCETWIKSNCGKDSQEILRLLKALLKQAIPGIKDEELKCYDLMNEKIKQSLNSAVE